MALLRKLGRPPRPRATRRGRRDRVHEFALDPPDRVRDSSPGDPPSVWVSASASGRAGEPRLRPTKPSTREPLEPSCHGIPNRAGSA
jgi:hypothetical protein